MNNNVKRKRKIYWKRFFAFLFITFCVIYTISNLSYRAICYISDMIKVEAKVEDIKTASTEPEIVVNENINIKEKMETDGENSDLSVEDNEEELVKPENMPEEYFNYAKEIAEKENAPLDLMIAILLTENELFDADIVYGPNDDGSYDIGLCQVNSNYIDYFAKLYNIKNFDPYDVYDSLEFLAKHVNYLKNEGLNKYNIENENIYMFIAGAYNRGISNEIKYQNMYHYKEKVQNYLNDLEYV